jgi:ABC-2 type transport system permease protein
MSVFRRELKAYRNSTIIWTVALSLLVVTFLSLFPSFSNDVEVTKKILENLPPVVSSAIGISAQNFFNIYGFLSYLFTFVMLVGSVQAMNIGVGILSKEESSKTADFLLTKPISRSKVITNKLFAAFILLIITNIVFCSVALMMAVLVSIDSFDITTFLLVSAKLVLVQIIFLSLGFLLSVIIPKIKSTITVSLPVVFGFFIAGTVGEILRLDYIKYISPFKLYDSEYIISHNAYDIKLLLFEAVFVIVMTAASYIIFIKKDIRAAV